jgi:formylglycine-generating enzyme required for sulfatase activity
MEYRSWIIVMALTLAAMTVRAAQADVFKMGSGLTSLEMVPVGDPGNMADTAAHSGNSAGQGAVTYNYQIGKYEVTGGQYTEFLNAMAKTDTYGLYNGSMGSVTYGCKIQQSGSSGNYTYSVASDYANRPVNWVSYWDACRFANWLHNGQPTGEQGVGTTETGAYTLTSDGIINNTTVRNADWKWAVASENEWYKAAYYKGGVNASYWDYPTSSNAVPGRDMADVSGNNANYHNVGDLPYPIDSDNYMTLVGEFQNSDSPYGTFDQGGNVWEWNEAVIDSSRGLRGGSGFLSSSADLLAYVRYHSGYGETFEGYDVGFRVTCVPEPNSLIILAGIALTALLYRRRAGIIPVFRPTPRKL